MIPAGSLSAQGLHLIGLAAAAMGPAAPARRFLGAGSEADTAWECEQITASLSRADEVRGGAGVAGVRPSPTHPGRVAMIQQRWVLEVVKEYPPAAAEGAQDPGELTAAATVMQDAGAAIYNAFADAAADGTLAEGTRHVGQYSTTGEGLTWIGPLGGYSAVRLAFLLTVV